MRVLIVDDDFVNRRIMQAIFAEYGTCDVAVNGKEALEIFKYVCDEGQFFDLICLDLMMPEMDGHEVLRKVREYEELIGIDGENAVKVLITTALDDSENVIKAFNEQCEGYIVKPINFEKMKDVLKKLELI